MDLSTLIRPVAFAKYQGRIEFLQLPMLKRSEKYRAAIPRTSRLKRSAAPEFLHVSET